jgi:hypothetical protein
VASFIVETYEPIDAAAPGGVTARAGLAAALLAAAGGRIRHLRSYVVPGDEQCFHVFEADSPDDLIRAARLAGVEIERIVEAVDLEAVDLEPVDLEPEPGGGAR